MKCLRFLVSKTHARERKIVYYTCPVTYLARSWTWAKGEGKNHRSMTSGAKKRTPKGGEEAIFERRGQEVTTGG